MSRRSMHRRHREPVSTIPDTFWMVSFSDLLTLLLTFFVMRVAMGNIDPERFQAVLQKTATAEQSVTPSTEQQLREVLELYDASPQAGDLPESEVFEASPEFKVASGKDGTMLLLGGNTFETGSDVLSERARETLTELAAVLGAQRGQIEIAGNTDDVPIASQRFASNWELSTARAISVARVLIEAGVSAERISVVGYADTKPLVPNDSAMNRAQNRRVEVLLAEP